MNFASRPTARRFLARLGALCLVAALAGCSFGPEGDVHAGVVMERGTDEPIEGIHVSFQLVGNVGNTSIVSETLTDAEGRFRLRRTSGALFINSLPYGADPGLYNPAYSGGVFTIGNSHPLALRFELTGPGTPP